MSWVEKTRARRAGAKNDATGALSRGLSAPRAAMVGALVARFRRRASAQANPSAAVGAFLRALRAEDAPAEVIAAVAQRLRAEARDKPGDPGVARGPTPSFAERIARERAGRVPALAR